MPLITRDLEICAMFLVLCRPLWGIIMKTSESGLAQFKALKCSIFSFSLSLHNSVVFN